NIRKLAASKSAADHLHSTAIGLSRRPDRTKATSWPRANTRPHGPARGPLSRSVRSAPKLHQDPPVENPARRASRPQNHYQIRRPWRRYNLGRPMRAERTNHRCDEGSLQHLEVIADGGAGDFAWGRESRRFKQSATLRHQPLRNASSVP